MAKERLHEMTETSSSFQVRGIVTNTKGKRFYRSGTSGNGNNWNGIEFGVRIGDQKTVFVTLNGFPRPEVFYYKRGENGAKGDTKKVSWKDRKKSPGEGYRLIGVNVSTGKNADGKNVNETMTEYDAVEWMHSNLQDGDSVFIKGNLQFSSYTDRNGQTRKKVELVPTQISYTQKPVDFDAEDYVKMAEFENTLVFSGIEPELDEKDQKTGRYVLSGWSIGYNSVESVSFIVDAAHSKLALNLKKAMKTGYAIKTYGRIEVINDVVQVESDDSGWGEVSPMERTNGPTRREYVVYRADPTSIEKDKYNEEGIAAAIRKIKAAKNAVENFGESVNSSNAVDLDDWGADDSEESPW